MPIMDLVEKAGVGGSTVQNGVRSLLEMGLIKDDREKHPPFKRTISLTVFGEKAAAALLDAEGYIEQAQKHVKA